jgi:hypothetical protein
VKTILRLLPIAASLTIAIVFASTVSAAALSDADLLGNWCGRESNYSFSRKVMIVTRPSDSERLVFDIIAFEPREGRIAVSWQRADGKVVRTEFAEFSTDGKQMVQLSNSGGPRREFRRC